MGIENIKREIITFYEKLYCENEKFRPYYNMYQWPTMNIEDQQELQQPFEEKEVLDGLKACAVDKAQVQMGTLWGSLFIVGRS